jgi:hypothetical protein
MSTEYGMFSDPDFGYADFVGGQQTDLQADPRYDGAGQSHLPVDAAQTVSHELARLKDVPRQLAENVDYAWSDQGRLKLDETILTRFTVEEVAAQVRELEATGPSRRPMTSSRRGKFTLEWDGDASVVDLHSEAVGAHPDFVQNLMGGGQQRVAEQPARAFGPAASAETSALPAGSAGMSAPETRSKSKRQRVAEAIAESGPISPSLLSRAWGLRPNIDWRSPNAWRKRLKRAEWCGYIIAAELVMPFAINAVDGDSSLSDRNYFLQTPIAVTHGVERVIHMATGVGGFFLG